ncbi:MAG: hypothetical protein AAFY16_12570, partial [Cyanobacteria bacterium J06642_3]
PISPSPHLPISPSPHLPSQLKITITSSYTHSLRFHMLLNKIATIKLGKDKSSYLHPHQPDLTN